MKVLVFDTETTGLPTHYNSSIYNTDEWPHIVQLSYILYDTTASKILTTVNVNIKLPENIEISDESIKIHGITKAICDKNGIDIVKALHDFNAEMNKADTVIGHNISFDKRVVMVECIRNKINQSFTINGVKKPEFCTMKNAVDLCAIEKVNTKTGEKYYKYPTLSELHKKLFGNIPKGTHDALADVLICLRCYGMLEHKYDILKTGCDEFIKMYSNICM